MEKFINFSIGSLQFKDSAQFLLSSLDKLVSNLQKKAVKENNTQEIFRNTWEYLSRKKLPEEVFALLTRKGVYSYRYMNGWDKMKETTLPPKEEYYNDLVQRHISDEDYQRAMEIWKTFGIDTEMELNKKFSKAEKLRLHCCGTDKTNC